MALKHGTLTLPGDIVATGVIINTVTTKKSAIKIIEKNQAGVFEPGNGKTLARQGNYTIAGKCLATAALPDVGSGGNTEASPYVQDVEVADENEGASKFSITAESEEEVLEDF